MVREETGLTVCTHFHQAAIWALKRMNVGPILLVNRDAEEL